MRVLFVIPYFYPALAFGGPVISSYHIARGLVSKGHEVTVFTSDAESATKRIPTSHEFLDGISVYRFQNLSMYSVRKSKVFLTPTMWPALHQSVGGYDVIHLHEYRTLQSVFGHHFAIKYNVPYVLQAHSTLPRAGRNLRKFAFDNLFGRSLLADCKSAIALTTTEFRQYRNMGVPSRKIVIVPTGIDTSLYKSRGESSFRRVYRLPGNAQIVLYLGRLHWSKGLAALVKAQAFLVQKLKYRDAILVLAGPDDGFLRQVQQLAHNLGIQEFVHLTGFLSPQMKLEALREATLFVSPSYLGFPTTFLESLAVGTPILTTTAGDKLEWLQEVGIVAPPESTSLAEEMYLMLTNQSLRNRLSQNCAKVVQRFSMDRSVSSFEEVYSEISSKEARRTGNSSGVI